MSNNRNGLNGHFGQLVGHGYKHSHPQSSLMTYFNPKHGGIILQNKKNLNTKKFVTLPQCKVIEKSVM